jgi:hypothetical protein
MNAQELADELNRTFSLEHGISVKALERALNEAEQRGYAEGRLDGALNCDEHAKAAYEKGKSESWAHLNVTITGLQEDLKRAREER